MLQDALPQAVYEAAKQCLEAFRKKDDRLMTMEIDAFIRHHSDVCTYQQQADARQRAKEAVLAQRSAYVAAALEKYDRNLLLEAEARVWQWSPLFLRLLEKPVPGFLTLPCRHNEEEFQDILTWVRAECQHQVGKTTAPPFVRALKLFSRGENGVDAPMICPRVGVSWLASPGSLYDRMPQVKFAMKDLPTLGMLLFPTMDITSEEFQAFTDVTSSGVGFEGLLDMAASWMRACFWRACNDMLALDKEDELRVLWLEASKERRDRALEAFWRIMLLREGVDLEYALCCLDWTGEWNVVPQDVLQAMKDLRDVSMKFCLTRLSPWSGGQSQPVHLADLEGLDLGDFGASQVLCTMEALGRVGDLGDMSQQGSGGGGEGADAQAEEDPGAKAHDALTKDAVCKRGVAEVVSASDYKTEDNNVGDVVQLG